MKFLPLFVKCDLCWCFLYAWSNFCAESLLCRFPVPLCWHCSSRHQPCSGGTCCPAATQASGLCCRGCAVEVAPQRLQSWVLMLLGVKKAPKCLCSKSRKPPRLIRGSLCSQVESSISLRQPLPWEIWRSRWRGERTARHVVLPEPGLQRRSPSQGMAESNLPCEAELREPPRISAISFYGYRVDISGHY